MPPGARPYGSNDDVLDSGELVRLKSTGAGAWVKRGWKGRRAIQAVVEGAEDLRRRLPRKRSAGLCGPRCMTAACPRARQDCPRWEAEAVLTPTQHVIKGGYQREGPLTPKPCLRCSSTGNATFGSTAVRRSRSGTFVAQSQRNRGEAIMDRCPLLSPDGPACAPLRVARPRWST